MKLVIHYEVEVSEEAMREAEKTARELGYDYRDAGRIETVRRYLVAEGMESVFREERFESKSTGRSAASGVVETSWSSPDFTFVAESFQAVLKP